MMQSWFALAYDVYVPPQSPIVFLLFLGSAAVVLAGAASAGILAALGRRRLARIAAAGALGVAVVYGVLLLGASLLSRERTLRAGERKYFCEMDCHIAYSVESEATSESGGRIVTVRTWFDPATIASTRGNGPLTPNPLALYLVDESGHRHPPSEAATRTWDAGHPGSTPLTRELRPGESYTTAFAFESLPETAGGRLFLGVPPGPENLILTHENSPFHAKTYFELPRGVPRPVPHS